MITRLKEDASKQNPVIALDQKTHKQVNELQEQLGTENMSVKKSITTNVTILKQVGIPQSTVSQIKKQAISHAKNLKIY